MKSLLHNWFKKLKCFFISHLKAFSRSAPTMEYTITKEDFIGFWRDGGGEKFFFDNMISKLIIDVIDEEMIKEGVAFHELFYECLLPSVSIMLDTLGLSEEQIVMYMCDLMWLVLLAIANMYEDKYIDVPEIKWVFDTPDHPFEQYLVAKMPDAREKYRTAERSLADYL